MDHVDEITQRENWQLTNLVDLGFEPTEAIDILRDSIDYHEIATLMDRGCDKHIALRILAPL
jgi:uncharacterized protein (DUF1330 family)